MLIEVTVVPNSGRFSVSLNERIKIFLKSPPENNRANRELVKELSKLLGAEVRLVGGYASRRKKLEVNEAAWNAFIASRQV